MEALYSLYHRPRFSEHDFKVLVGPMFEPETMSMLNQLFHWLSVDPTDIDDAKYLLVKRFSEASIPGNFDMAF